MQECQRAPYFGLSHMLDEGMTATPFTLEQLRGVS
jgi:hypothetical protein